jgi:hypothetical protein
MAQQAPFKGKICCIGAGYVGGPTMAMVRVALPPSESFLFSAALHLRLAWDVPQRGRRRLSHSLPTHQRRNHVLCYSRFAGRWRSRVGCT